MEGTSLEETQQIMQHTLNVDLAQEQYRGNAIINIDSIQFIDDPIMIFNIFI